MANNIYKKYILLIFLLKQKYNLYLMSYSEERDKREQLYELKLQQKQRKGQQKGLYNGENNIQEVKRSIGILKSNWYSNKILVSQAYGTAFAIGAQKLLTCTHNIFSRGKKCFATQIQFYPSIQTGFVKKQGIITQRLLEYNKNIFSIFDNSQSSKYKNFDQKPIEDQVSIIFLSNKISIKQFIKIGQLDDKKLHQRDQKIDLQIFGYPSQSFAFESLVSASIKRTHLKGFYSDIEKDFIIHHTLQTKVGCSGSPILAKSNEMYYAVGIHTHKGRGNLNSGIYFSQRILQKILGLEFSIYMKYSVNPDIQFINFKRQSSSSVESDNLSLQSLTSLKNILAPQMMKSQIQQEQDSLLQKKQQKELQIKVIEDQLKEDQVKEEQKDQQKGQQQDQQPLYYCGQQDQQKAEQQDELKDAQNGEQKDEQSFSQNEQISQSLNVSKISLNIFLDIQSPQISSKQYSQSGSSIQDVSHIQLFPQESNQSNQSNRNSLISNQEEQPFYNSQGSQSDGNRSIINFQEYLDFFTIIKQKIEISSQKKENAQASTIYFVNSQLKLFCLFIEECFLKESRIFFLLCLNCLPFLVLILNILKLVEKQQ